MEKLSAEDAQLIASLRKAEQTITSTAAKSNPEVDRRLKFVADLVTRAGEIPSQPVLLYRTADQQVQPLVIGSELVVGRSKPSGLIIEEDRELSREHFKITTGGGLFILEDLKSHNGTFVNSYDCRVTRRELRDGDLILAGEQLFVFLKPVDAYVVGG